MSESNESTALVLSQEDLRERSEKLDAIQEMYEELAYIQEPKMPCNECSGAGTVYGGSLGDICVKCMGARVINRPFYEPVVQPDFKALRASITYYGDALRTDGELPPVSSVFGKDDYNELYAQGRAEVRILAAHEAALQLAAGGTDCEDDNALKPWK
jgi:hypothetical protein